MPARVAAGLRRHACATLPVECCGGLLGRRSGAGAEVRLMVPLDNDDPAPDRYRIDAPAVLQLERRAGRAGLDLLGFYHSHPGGPPTPSLADLELACPGYLYVIVQPGAGAVRAWRLLEDRAAFAELPIIVDAPGGVPMRRGSGQGTA
jgi:desampylase